MKNSVLLLSSFAILLFISSCSGSNGDREVLVNLETSKGNIKVKLYNDTPGHRDNFIKLVKEGFYDGIKFHRVISDFMIQAGDASTKGDTSSLFLEKYRYTIPAEIDSVHFHKKGVLAAARMGDMYNPDRKSSGTQFYLVQGMVFRDTVINGDTLLADDQLNNIEKRVDANLKQAVYYKYLSAEKKRVIETGDNKTDAEIQEFASMVAYDEIAEMKPYRIAQERRDVYRTVGGVPHLDMQYTVFGEIVEGLDVLDTIAGVKTDPRNDRPIEDVLIIKARVVRK